MNAKQLIDAATPSGVLIAAAEDLKNRARQGGSQPTMTSDLWLARHILSTVRPDDDEPVTRKRLEADGWFTHERFPGQFRHDEFPLLGLTQSGTDFRIDDHGRRLKSMGHLRRLVAALGE